MRNNQFLMVILFLFIYKLGILNEIFLERIIRATIYLRKNDELTAPFVNPNIQFVEFHI